MDLENFLPSRKLKDLEDISGCSIKSYIDKNKALTFLIKPNTEINLIQGQVLYMLIEYFEKEGYKGEKVNEVEYRFSKDDVNFFS